MQKPVAHEIALHTATWPRNTFRRLYMRLGRRSNFIYGQLFRSRAAKVSGNYIIREQEADERARLKKRGCRCKIRFDMEKTGARAHSSPLSYFATAVALKRKTGTLKVCRAPLLLETNYLPSLKCHECH